LSLIWEGKTNAGGLKFPSPKREEEKSRVKFPPMKRQIFEMALTELGEIFVRTPEEVLDEIECDVVRACYLRLTCKVNKRFVNKKIRGDENSPNSTLLYNSNLIDCGSHTFPRGSILAFLTHYYLLFTFCAVRLILDGKPTCHFQRVISYIDRGRCAAPETHAATPGGLDGLQPYVNGIGEVFCL
jgi:hypothetical protein